MPMTSQPAISRSTGFTLIEILVTLVILMIGLLGIAGLMAQGQRASFEAYQRQQALTLANDMAERIKANRPGVDNTVVGTTYAAAIALGTPAGTGTRFTALKAGSITNCATTICTAADTVQYDAALWDGLLGGGASETEAATGTALGPLISPRGCIQSPPPGVAAPAGCPACGGPPASHQVTYRVSVAWQGNFATVDPPESACGAADLGTTGLRRLVYIDVVTVLACACPL